MIPSLKKSSYDELTIIVSPPDSLVSQVVNENLVI